MALLEVAKNAASLPDHVQLIAFDGEEMHKVGAYRYANHLLQEGKLGNVRLVINLDSVGIGERLYALTSPSIEQQVKSALAEFNIDISSRETFKQFDSWPFMKEGVDVIQIGSNFIDRENSFCYFNAPKDTVGGNGFDLNSNFIILAGSVVNSILSEWA